MNAFLIFTLSLIFAFQQFPGVEAHPTSYTARRPDGARRLNINLTGSLQNPSFSPDGKSLLFTRFRDGYNKGSSELYIYNLETGSLRLLMSDNTSNVNLPGSSWNATIHAIVFSSDREPHDEIYLIDENGSTGDEVRITDRQNKQSFEPTLSPDGRWVVFESHDIDVEDDGIITIYKLDHSSGYINLTFPQQNCKQPNWSPTGDRILYQRFASGKWSVWTMNTDGSDVTRVTGPEESATDAVFSPDGQWIIYSSENDNVELANIHKIPAGGGTPVRITKYRGYDGAPAISPDGSRIAFESVFGDPEQSTGTKLWVINISGD